ncbi:unnamed protein product [Rotaria sp. Silwood2]|nr:unnamed protein product [Rotaria sp. Silwood2]
MAEFILTLIIIAQPKALHRERYFCEIDRSRNRSQRFIRAEANSDRLEYPTIEIPKQWDSQRLYIRVTLVTVCSEQVPVTCVHPYPIDTSELNVIKDVAKNTLYFPISEEELNNGRKSFRIIRRKLTQQELRNYGQLSLLNTDEKDIRRTDDPYDVRRIIDVYQLGKSQLLFSIAELIDDHSLPVIYDVTSVYSHITTAITTASINNDESFVRWAPKKGCWQGGDDILMVVPKLDKRKVCQVYFECLSSNEKSHINFEFVDMKTIAFKTPPCPIQAIEDENIVIPIVISQSGEEIARVNFMYQAYWNKISAEDIDFDEKKWEAFINSDEVYTGQFSKSINTIDTTNINFDKKDIVKLSVNCLKKLTFINSDKFIHTGRSMAILISPSSNQRVRYENECEKILRYLSVPNKRTMTIKIPDVRDMFGIDDMIWMRITRTTIDHRKDNLIFYHPYPTWIKDKSARIHNGSIFIPITDRDMENGFIEIDTIALIRLKQDDLAKINTLGIYSRTQLNFVDLHSLDITTPKCTRDEYILRQSILNFQLVRIDQNNIAYLTDCFCQTESIHEIEGKISCCLQ